MNRFQCFPVGRRPAWQPETVEDGTFSPNCIKGAGTADPGVLDAYSYRHPIGDVVRILVPWNIATVGATPLSCLQTYLTDARTASVPVEVSLNNPGWATLAGKYFSIAKATFAGLGIQMIAGDFSSTAVSADNLSTYITAAGGVGSSCVYYALTTPEAGCP